MASKKIVWHSLGRFPLAEFHLDATLTSGQTHYWRKVKGVESRKDMWCGVLGPKVYFVRQYADEKKLQNNNEERNSYLVEFCSSGDVTRISTGEDIQILTKYFSLDTSLLDRIQQWKGIGRMNCVGSQRPPRRKTNNNSATSVGGRSVLNELFSNTIETVQDRCGIRLLQQDPVACLFSFVCSQNNNIARISSMVLKLCELFGSRITVTPPEGFDQQSSKKNPNTLSHFTFPKPEQILSKPSAEEILRAGFGYRAGYIVEAAKWLKENDIHLLHSDSGMSLDMARKQLMSIKGVGRKVADCVLLFSLGHRDVVPVDTHIQQIAEKYLGLTGTLTTARHNEVAKDFLAAFGPDCGWAHCVLFYSKLMSGKSLRENEKGETVEEKDEVPARAKRRKLK